MKFRRMYVLAGLAVLLIALLSSGFVTSAVTGTMAGPQAKATSTPPPFPDAYKLNNDKPSANAPGVTASSPQAISHPCSGMYPEPPFEGLSPITVTYPYVTCQTNGQMGDIATWQHGGHDYVGTSGFGGRLFFIYNVDDPYNPVLLRNEPRPAGSSASLSIFDWTQNGNQYLSVTTRGTGTGCGWFAYNVTDPANAVQVASVRNPDDWCTVHEHFVSLDNNGNADYAWFTMSGEGGSEGKIIAMDIRNLSNIVEVNRWDRDGDSGYFIHDSNVVRGKMYAGHWDGGMNIFDKAAFVAGGTPVPLNPVGSIQPAGFRVHHVVPTSDDRYVLLQDEFINSATLGKLKLYDIQNLSSPQFVADITGGDPIADREQAHNMIIKNLSSGTDLLINAWYRAGIRGYVINTNASPPTITQEFRHQLRNVTTGCTGGPGACFGNVWGVDWLPCTVRGLERTCLYAGDMTFGLVVNAVNTDNFQPDPTLDPYAPNVPLITSPTQGQEISTCSFNITGTAHDYWSGLQRVEVSVDGGSTWNTATGTETWSYQWNIQSSGAYTIKARAFDMAENVANAVDINVTVTASCPLTTPTAGPTFTVAPPTSTRTNTPVGSTATNTPTSTSTVVAATATATIVPCDMIFIDVSEADWFYSYLHCLYCRAIVGGYPDGTFRPGNDITRGQIAKIVALSAGYTDPVSEQTFEDVAVGSTFYTWIEQLAMHDVISGYDCGGPGEPCGVGSRPYFRPNSNATRGQMTKIIVLSSGMPIDTTGGPHFTDVLADHTFYDYVETMYNAGAIEGYPDGTFRPANNVTRAQSTKMVVLVFFPQCAAR